MHPRHALLGLLAALPLQAAIAQDHAHTGMERLGRVTFPISCAGESGHRFEHAMAVIHSFWWEEAPRAFNHVLDADSSCAIAYWGLALSHWQNPFAGGASGPGLRAGAAAAERAVALGSRNAREQGLINAAGALYRDFANTAHRARLLAYADTMTRVYRDFGSDTEVALYYALSLVATASPTDTTYAKQRQAAAILNPLYARYPDHPGLAHYIIHANDQPALAQLGLAAARRYADIAPAAPHAQHMPSHIFIRLGLWSETVESNRRSYDAGVGYARAQGLQGVDYHEFHAQDYMVYGFLQQGRDSAARATVNEAMAQTVVRSPSALVGSYNRVAMEARLFLEKSDWAGAAQLPVRYAEPATSEMLSRFTRGIGAARSGNLAQAREELAALERIEQALTRANDTYWSRVAGIKRQAVNAWVLLASGDTTGALREAKDAADKEDVTSKHPITPGELLPARELEADLHLQLGHYGPARTAYQVTLRHEPGRARAIFGQARAAQLAGDRTAASRGYREFIQLLQPGDGRREELATARAGSR